MERKILRPGDPALYETSGPVEWADGDDTSELIQHEYDHLDGILAAMRAIDGKSFVMRG